MSHHRVRFGLNSALVLFSSIALTSASFKFNNVKCEDHDVAFSSFEKCKLTVIRRGVNSLNIYEGLYKSPVTNTSINSAFYRKTNGYRPYMFNRSADVCAYFLERKKYPVLDWLFSIFLQHSNINHTCPFSDAIIVKDLVLEERMFAVVPMPPGQYMLQLKVYAYNSLKATMKVFYSRT